MIPPGDLESSGPDSDLGPAPTGESESRGGGTPRRGAGLWIPVVVLVVGGAGAFLLASSLTRVEVSGATQFKRAAYCSVDGNTAPDGSPLPPGTFLDLVIGQAGNDDHLAGAQPANFIEGAGLTCSAPPAGFVRRGFATAADSVTAGVHPYYAPGSP